VEAPRGSLYTCSCFERLDEESDGVLAVRGPGMCGHGKSPPAAGLE
jgi:hypothetical protein